MGQSFSVGDIFVAPSLNPFRSFHGIRHHPIQRGFNLSARGTLAETLACFAVNPLVNLRRVERGFKVAGDTASRRWRCSWRVTRYQFFQGI